VGCSPACSTTSPRPRQRSGESKAKQSAEAHLLYARALEAGGRSQEALDEYRALSAYYPGAEPRVRYGLLLNLLGRRDEARTLFADVVKQLRRAPKHVRKLQGEWIAIAERESRA